MWGVTGDTRSRAVFLQRVSKSVRPLFGGGCDLGMQISGAEEHFPPRCEVIKKQQAELGTANTVVQRLIAQTQRWLTAASITPLPFPESCCIKGWNNSNRSESFVPGKTQLMRQFPRLRILDKGVRPQRPQRPCTQVCVQGWTERRGL